MRLIAKFNKENLAKKFSFFLQKEGIINSIESEIDKETNDRILLIWVEDEDLTEKATELYRTFIENSGDPKYDIPIAKAHKRPLIQDIPIKVEEKVIKKTPISFTMIVIVICAAFYFLNLVQEISIIKKEGKKIALITPIQLFLFYDVPPPLLRLSKVLQKYPIESSTPLSDLPPKFQKELKEINEMPQWRGIYPWVLGKIGKPKEALSGPMFVKIRQGQLWRLFSPCLLHTTLLHILFNMLWAFVLLKQVEQKVKKWKIILLIVIIGIFSNTCQYLMSGPMFLGFSGVVVGLAGYIWSRQKIAPWEGYIISKSTFIFLAIFVFGMMGIQILFFVSQAVGSNFFPYDISIANTAHISGGIAGWLLGKLSFFSAEVS